MISQYGKLNFGRKNNTYSELHGLGTSSTELSRNNNLATLGTRLHDKAEDTIAGPADGKTVEKLVAEGLALSDGGQTTVLNLGGVERNGVLGELEALLDERGEFADATTLLSENLLCVGGADDDVGDSGGDADLDTGVTFLSELALEELVQFGVEHTVCENMLATAHCAQSFLHRVRLQCCCDHPILPHQVNSISLQVSTLLLFVLLEVVYRTGNELSPLGAARRQ